MREQDLAPWSPLTEPDFRNIWLANLGSNIGSWMQDVASAWLMTSLTTSPVLVALIQTANFLPIFIFGIPAGALADSFSKRKIVMWAQIWMLVFALILSVLTFTGCITPWTLLALTFVLSIGSAVFTPIFSALLPNLVSREQLEKALTINSTGRHIARGFGSALGGMLMAIIGAAGVFLFNALSFIIVWSTFKTWKSESFINTSNSANLIDAIISSFKYIQKTPAVHNVIIRNMIFGLPSSTFWALLPLVGREQIKLNVVEYGLMLGCFSIGSLFGVVVLPRLRTYFSIQASSIIGSICFAFTMLIISQIHSFLLACSIIFLAGTGWIIVVSMLNYSIQHNCIEDMRARVLAIFVVFWQGSVAIGSYLAGLFALHYGIQNTFIVSGIILLFTLITTRTYRLTLIENSPNALKS